MCGSWPGQLPSTQSGFRRKPTLPRFVAKRGAVAAHLRRLNGQASNTVMAHSCLLFEMPAVRDSVITFLVRAHEVPGMGFNLLFLGVASEGCRWTWWDSASSLHLYDHRTPTRKGRVAYRGSLTGTMIPQENIDYKHFLLR
jgi:hypothetical protein